MKISEQIQSLRSAVGKEYTRPNIEKLEKAKMLLLGNDSALDYLRIERGFTDETIKHFQLGYDSDKDAIAIPIFKRGELVNIKYRFLNPTDAKYIGERNAECWVYNDDGIEVAKEKKGVLIVEGEFDCMACWQAGIKNVISPASGKDSYGTWIELLDHVPRVYIAYDNDEAGRTSGRKFAERIGSDKCHEVKYPDEIKDANDYFKLHTIEEYRNLLKKAAPYYSYQFKNLGNIINDLRSNKDEVIELKTVPNVLIEKDWLLVLSGDTNVGKTSYCMNIADELASRGIPSLIMPFERGITSVGKRFLQVFFNKTQDDFKFTSTDEWEHMINRAVEAPVYFSTPKREDIKEIVVKSKRLFDTRVVIIDHLDYIVRHSNGNESSVIASTLQDLKMTGSEHGIIFIVVTHLRKRENGQSPTSEPHLDDLKGSSSLKQDPECVVLLSQTEGGDIKVNVAKNKGQMGKYTFGINLETGRLKDPMDF